MQGPWNGAAESTEGMQLSRASSSLGGSRSSVAPRPQRSPVGPVVPSVASRRGLAGLAVHQRGGRSTKEAGRLVPPCLASPFRITCRGLSGAVVSQSWPVWY